MSRVCWVSDLPLVSDLPFVFHSNYQDITALKDFVYGLLSKENHRGANYTMDTFLCVYSNYCPYSTDPC